MRQIKRLLPVFLVAVIAVCMAFAVACAKKYTVTFDTDGGSEVASQTVTSGQKAEKPEDPAKANYEFDGWFLGESKYDFETSVTDDVTLTAHWTRLYAVMFNTDGGNKIATAITRAGETATKPADPTKTGYTFAGWYNGETEYNFTETVTGDVKLTAHWTINVYTVTYNSDGGTEYEAVNVNHGSKVTLPIPEKWGYDFAGWYNGETAYEVEAVTGNLTLTAHWTAWEAWTDESKTQLTDIVINADAVKKAYNIGEQLNTEGLKVCLVSVTEEGVYSNYYVAEEEIAEKVTVDSSEYNVNKEGTYTIYVTYTHSGISRHASYEVTVTSVISGIHGIIIEKEETDYDVTVAGNDPTAIPVDDVKVYAANEDGTKGDEITEGVTYEYYLGNKKVELSTLTTANARVYQIWANVNYTVDTETYVMSNFVLVRVNGNNITKMEFVSEGAKTSQTQSYSDLMSGTWKFNVEYRLGQTGQIDLSTAEVGSGDNQYTLENFSPATVGTGVATLTYHYAVGAEIWKYSVEVPYTVTEPKEDSTFKAVIDIGKADDSLNYGDDSYYNITSTIKKGAEIVPFMVYANTGSDLSISSESKGSAVDGEPNLNDRIQLNNGSKSLKLFLAGPATITIKARTGNKDTKGKVALKQGDTIVAESEEFNNTSKYQTFTVEAPAAGEYILIFNASGSLNTYSIEIEGTIKGKVELKVEPKVVLNANDLTVGSLSKDNNPNKLSDDFTANVGSKSLAIKDVSSSPVTIGGMEFTKSISFGGGNKDTYIGFTVTEDMVAAGSVKVLVYANHGGGAGTTRPLVLATGGSAVGTVNVDGAGTVAEYTITEAGEYSLYSGNSGQNIFYIALYYDVAEVA